MCIRDSYVVGSRFAEGRPKLMLWRRSVGNRVLTTWVRRLTHLPVTDGQSGYRALSPSAAVAAEVIHDYNYAQVLTLDLVAKGFRYAEVPISYRFRSTGRSFVNVGRYLRQVVPAVRRQLRSSPVSVAGPSAPLLGARTVSVPPLGASSVTPTAVD